MTARALEPLHAVAQLAFYLLVEDGQGRPVLDASGSEKVKKELAGLYKSAELISAVDGLLMLSFMLGQGALSCAADSIEALIDDEVKRAVSALLVSDAQAQTRSEKFLGAQREMPSNAPPPKDAISVALLAKRKV